MYVFSFHAGREDDNKVTDGRTDKCTQFPISSGSVRKEGSKPVTDSVGLLLTTLSLPLPSGMASFYNVPILH